MKKIIYLKDETTKYYIEIDGENKFEILKENMLFSGNSFYQNLYKGKKFSDIDYEISNSCTISTNGDEGKKTNLLVSRLNELFSSIYKKLELEQDEATEEIDAPDDDPEIDNNNG